MCVALRSRSTCFLPGPLEDMGQDEGSRFEMGNSL